MISLIGLFRESFREHGDEGHQRPIQTAAQTSNSSDSHSRGECERRAVAIHLLPVSDVSPRTSKRFPREIARSQCQHYSRSNRASSQIFCTTSVRRLGLRESRRLLGPELHAVHVTEPFSLPAMQDAEIPP